MNSVKEEQDVDVLMSDLLSHTVKHLHVAAHPSATNSKVNPSPYLKLLLALQTGTKIFLSPESSVDAQKAFGIMDHGRVMCTWSDYVYWRMPSSVLTLTTSHTFYHAMMLKEKLIF